MNSDQKSTLAKLAKLADHARKVGRPEIADSTHEGFSYRQIVALHDLFEDLAGDQCHDRSCVVHFKGVPLTGPRSANGD